MLRPLLIAALLAVPGSRVLADPAPPPADAAPALSDPIPGLTPAWTPLDPPKPAVGRRPTPNPFVDASVDLDFPVLHGRRLPLSGFTPAAPWRYPALDGGKLDHPDVISNARGDGVMGLDLRGGYRLDGGWGEMLMGLRVLDGSGRRYRVNGDPLNDQYIQALYKFGGRVGGLNFPAGTVVLPETGWPDPLGAALVGTSLTAYAVDFAYGNGLYTLPVADVWWTAGGRVGGVETYDAIRSRGIESRTDSRYGGAGPAASLAVEWHLGEFASGDGAVTLITRADGSLLYGRSRQTDRETTGDPYPFAFRYSSAQELRTVPTFGFEAALAIRGYAPRCSLMIGYRFETWKGVGRVGNSAWDLILHGAFVGFQGNY